MRLLPVPASEPPYDDELSGLPAQPALRLVPSPVQPATRTPPAPATVVNPPRRDGLADPAVVARALVQRLLEVRAGIRPVAQLRPHTTVELFEELQRLPAQKPPVSGRSAHSVRSVHAQTITDDVVEVCATVIRGPRAGAVALRLEARSDRWCCTQIAGV